MLNEVWYKNHRSGSFHLFDDSKEWLQMDKAGHAMTSYYIGLAGIESLKWSGVSDKKSALWGGSLGLMYLTGVELLDGYSDGWGFSLTDMVANGLGAGIAIGQELGWQEQRIKLKYSAHLTELAEIRPNLLGKSTPERLLKDYNGQTYWLSVNVNSFLRGDNNIPPWLNLAIGYGGEDMITGTENGDWCLDNPAICAQYQRYRQWYLSFDVDLTKFTYKRKVFKTIFGAFGFIKIPAPALEFSNGKLTPHLLYF